MQARKIIEFAVIVLLALSTLLLYPVPHQLEMTTLGQSGYESLAIADSIAHGHGFANPFREIVTGPSAHVAPLFPAFLALLIKYSASDAAAAILMTWSATLVVVLQICLLPFLARFLGLGFYTGVAASVAWLVAGLPREVFWEQNYSGVFITLTVFLMVMALRGPLKMQWLILCAVLWGVLLLLCPVALLALAAWFGVVYFRRVQQAKSLVILALIPVLMIAPWMLRNYSVFHRVVFVRDNLGIEMDVSNNSCASFSFVVNELTRCYAYHHPNENLDEIRHVGEVGEVAYNQERMQLAKAWINENPGAFATLTLKRFTAFWVPMFLSSELNVTKNPEFYSPLRDDVISMASLLGIVGAVLMWRKNRDAFLVVMIWLTTFPVIYYFTQYNERARIPVDWAILLLACYAISEVGKMLMTGRAVSGQ
jgi:hypothetical protein